MATDPQTKAVLRLENLPAELQRQLLSILDFEELGALIHASPTFYHQYRLNRRYVLCKCLDTTLRSVAVDAYAVYQSSLPSFKACCEETRKETLVPFVKGYQNRLSKQYSIYSENPSEEQVVNIVTFLFSVIQPLVGQFTSWTLINLAKETTTSYENQPLSKIEEIRILRGFYRYQLCCNIFGESWSYHDSSDTRFNSDYIWREFMQLVFEPWEIEEIICVLAFVTNQYDYIFNHLGWKVQGSYRSHSRWEPGENEDPALLQDPYQRSSCLTGTASRGLEILHNILFQPRTRTQLVSIVLENIREVDIIDFFEDSGFLTFDQTCIPTSEQRNRILKMQRGEQLLFDGDNEARLGEKYPPLAWTFIWQGTYSSLYGDVIPEDMRLWAYIMWDAVRLENTGAKDILTRQFTAEHPRDPRLGLGYWYDYNNTLTRLEFFS